MSTTPLAAAKEHSHIYHADWDADLQVKLDAAEEFVAKFFNRADLSELTQPDSPARLLAGVEILVLEVFDDYHNNRGAFVTGTIVSENPAWMRAAHLYRVELGV